MTHISEPFTKSSSKFLFKKKDSSLFNDIKIESNYIFFIPISQDYAKIIFEEFTPEIRKYMVVKVAKTVEDTRSFISESIQGQREERDLILVMLEKNNREFVGTIGLHSEIDGRNPRLGIWVKKKYHGKGISTEAIETVCKWAENNMFIDKFFFEVAAENIASRRIPEKFGGIIVRKGQIRTYESGLMEEVTYHIPVPVRRR